MRVDGEGRPYPGLDLKSAASNVSRTTVVTTGGTVFIDSAYPPGPPTRPGLAIISIHPPSPCRANNTSPNTVVFTPR